MLVSTIFKSCESGAQHTQPQQLGKVHVWLQFSSSATEVQQNKLATFQHPRFVCFTKISQVCFRRSLGRITFAYHQARSFVQQQLELTFHTIAYIFPTFQRSFNWKYFSKIAFFALKIVFNNIFCLHNEFLCTDILHAI